MKIYLIVLAIIAVIILVPWLNIWALNILFPVHIPFTFKTWLATIILFGSASSIPRSK
jgi:hypothetical protein